MVFHELESGVIEVLWSDVDRLPLYLEAPVEYIRTPLLKCPMPVDGVFYFKTRNEYYTIPESKIIFIKMKKNDR
jgi:hypothetical protein